MYGAVIPSPWHGDARRLALMKRLLFAFAFALVSNLVPGSARAQIAMEISIGLPVAPPLIVVQPGVQVVENYDEEIFFVGGWYWCRRGDYWYRARRPRASFVYVEPGYVPTRLAYLPPPGHYRRWHRHQAREDRHWWKEHDHDRRRAWREHDHRRAEWKRSGPRHDRGHGPAMNRPPEREHGMNRPAEHGRGPLPSGHSGHRASPLPSGPSEHRASQLPSGPSGHRASPLPSGPSGHRASPLPSGPSGHRASPLPSGPSEHRGSPAVARPADRGERHRDGNGGGHDRGR